MAIFLAIREIVCTEKLKYLKAKSMALIKVITSCESLVTNNGEISSLVQNPRR